MNLFLNTVKCFLNRIAQSECNAVSVAKFHFSFKFLDHTFLWRKTRHPSILQVLGSHIFVPKYENVFEFFYLCGNPNTHKCFHKTKIYSLTWDSRKSQLTLLYKGRGEVIPFVKKNTIGGEIGEKIVFVLCFGPID